MDHGLQESSSYQKNGRPKNPATNSRLDTLSSIALFISPATQIFTLKCTLRARTSPSIFVNLQAHLIEPVQ